MAQRAEMTVTDCSLTNWMRAHFLTGPTLCLDSGKSAHSDFTGWKVYVCLGVTCQLYSWQNDWDLLCAAAITWEWNRHRIRVSTQSWLWKRKFHCRSCQDSNSQPFYHESGALTNKLSWLPISIKISVNWAAGSSDKTNLSDNCDTHRLQNKVQQRVHHLKKMSSESLGSDHFHKDHHEFASTKPIHEGNKVCRQYTPTLLY